ncbi:MAG TPA: ABC transporter ATP-binding protein, partial [Rhizomicrobium sp.]
MAATILEVKNLDVRFSTPDGEVHAVKNANFRIEEGECLGVVGESGSGKSQLFLSTIGLLSGNGRATGSVLYRGREILGLPEKKLNELRGSKITMIFQDPLTSLTPHMTVGNQLMETLRVHQRVQAEDAEQRVLETLELVRIPEARQRMRQYPHELSGGMRQRVMIAMALAAAPRLLIADEPTTALDVTVQAQIMALLAELRTELGMAMIFITHDIGLVAGIADDIMVMQAGVAVEQGRLDDVLDHPQHDYTRHLLNAVPHFNGGRAARSDGARDRSAPVVTVDNLVVRFPTARRLFQQRGAVHAV